MKKILALSLVTLLIFGGCFGMLVPEAYAAIGTPVSQGITGAMSGSATATTTGAFTPTASAALFAYTTCFRNTSVPAQPTVSDSASLTWTEIIDQSYDSGSNRRMRARLMWAPIGASPVSMTVTGNCSDGVETTITVTEVSGVDTTNFTNVVASTSPAGDPASVLATFQSNSAGIGFVAGQGGNAYTELNSYTQLYDATVVSNSANRRQGVMYDLTSPNTTIGWTSTEAATIGVGLELLQLTVSAPTVTTQSASSVTSSTATGNGNITATGNENPDDEGFVYDTTSRSAPGNVNAASSGYASFASTTGSYSTGAFTKALSSLTSASRYYVRAFAHNSGGYGYGSETTFDTASVTAARVIRLLGVRLMGVRLR